MKALNNWEKLTSLPKGVIKEQGRFTGKYDLRISYIGDVWFIEYVFNGLFYGDIEPTYPDIFSGATLEEVVNKASSFFDANFGKYKLVG